MKLSKSIITKIQKNRFYRAGQWQLFYVVKYMDNTKRNYILSFDDYQSAIENYRDWIKDKSDSIHKETHTILLWNTIVGGAEITEVVKYNVQKNITDYKQVDLQVF